MKSFLFLLLLFKVFFCKLPDNDKNEKCFYLKKHRFIRRGQYQDTLYQTGSLLQNARAISLSNIQTKALPTIMALYTPPIGYTTQGLNTNLIFELIQSYEINTIRFWVYDRDGVNFYRPFNLQVYIQGPYIDSNKILVYDTTLAQGLVAFHFTDSLVKRIYFFNRGGSNLNTYLHFIKIQAYYSF